MITRIIPSSCNNPRNLNPRPSYTEHLYETSSIIYNSGQRNTQHRTELARYLTDSGHSPGDLDLLDLLMGKMSERHA